MRKREKGVGSVRGVMVAPRGTPVSRAKNIVTSPRPEWLVRAAVGLAKAFNKSTEIVTMAATSAMAAKGDSAVKAVAAVASAHGSEEVRSSISRCRS